MQTKTRTPSVVGKNIKRLRDRKGWTQNKLATLVGVTGPAIAQLESGAKQQPKPKTLESLAKAFGCGIPNLFVSR